MTRLTETQRKQQLYRLQSYLINLRAIGIAPASADPVAIVPDITGTSMLKSAFDKETELFPGTIDALNALCSVKCD